MGTALERFVNSYESAARFVKEAMDKKYNESWVVIVGQGFSFEVTHEVKHVLWMYFCDIAVLVYKAAVGVAREAAACEEEAAFAARGRASVPSQQSVRCIHCIVHIRLRPVCFG